MKNNNPLISIIVPIYNVEKYLNSCIESIVNQTYKNLEIILIDDGSTDKSPKICDTWRKKDKRIKVIHKKNGGVSSTRNVGLDNITGDYIGFVDSDDYLDENMYKSLMDSIKKNNTDIAICNYYIVEGNITNTGIKNSPSDILEKELLRDDSIRGYNWNKLYSRDIVKNIKFNTKVKIWEDLLFNYQIVSNNTINYSYVKEPLYYYVQNPISAVHSDYSMDFTRLDVLAFIIEKLKNIDINLSLEQQACYILMFENSKFICKERNIKLDNINDYEEKVRLYLKEGLLKENISIISKVKIILAVYFPKIYKLLKNILNNLMKYI